ncbi:glycosyltransferase family 4 protein [Methylomonas sp. MED-D]|uniref:glycosyltransferase family 4 protein n=1 Tax=unclassified Methylomonas TaxID=2608980 RepID=UPI0028A51388|nr:glycosyltransferase family 4 protein [Methylomonas sp. MV1]MDT4330994.1 glycosyltransferase family 4 protein [Methylomonas sp. MV1]
MPALKILWTLPYLPWPTTSGGKVRQYHLLRSLSERGHRITLLVQSKETLSESAREQLESVVERLIVLPRRPLKHPYSLAAAAFAPYPLLTSVNGLAPALEHQFSQLLKEPWDVVQIEHSYALQPYLHSLRDRRQDFVLTEHNVESSLGAATYQHLPKWIWPFVVYDQWRYRRWEKSALKSPARLIAVTESDAAELGRIAGRDVDVVINGVDTRGFASVVPDLTSQRILFVGNFEYPPNRDAVEWCLNDIMPKVWARMPEAKLAVCGYAMPEKWAGQWPDPRVEWCGFVNDLTLEQGRSAVFLAALREGGGSKLKVLEALAAGLPLVSTSQGVSGLSLQADVEYARGDDADGLATALIDSLRDPDRAGDMGKAGRLYAANHHDWRVAADQLESVYRKMTDARRN